MLADWIIDLAEHGGYIAQMTSVPGVAQRTGATIYYVELFPEGCRARSKTGAGADAGAGRCRYRAGFRTDGSRPRHHPRPGDALPHHPPPRPTASIRCWSVLHWPTAALMRVRCSYRTDEAARRLHAFDMASIADATGSLISSVMFGALAGSGTLPFQKMAFEATIRRGGVGVEPSVRAFNAGFEAASSGTRAGAAGRAAVRSGGARCRRTAPGRTHRRAVDRVASDRECGWCGSPITRARITRNFT